VKSLVFKRRGKKDDSFHHRETRAGQSSRGLKKKTRTSIMRGRRGKAAHTRACPTKRERRVRRVSSIIFRGGGTRQPASILGGGGGGGGGGRKGERGRGVVLHNSREKKNRRRYRLRARARCVILSEEKGGVATTVRTDRKEKQKDPPPRCLSITGGERKQRRGYCRMRIVRRSEGGETKGEERKRRPCTTEEKGDASTWLTAERRQASRKGVMPVPC